MPSARLLAILPVLLLLFLAAAYSLTQSDETMFLPVFAEARKSQPSVVVPRNLAMAYVPFNFGHTVAAAVHKVGIQWGDCGKRFGTAAECLGHQRSNVTGCELMYTPGKYWPTDLARSHFGNKTVFGILRDPYERLVAQFRGTGQWRTPRLFKECDVNGFVKLAMRRILTDPPYALNCLQLPQAEYFDQPFGATVFVDNRRFPDSANELLQKHGYTDVRILDEEVVHVVACGNKWAADLDDEAKAMVRRVYARDFELLCKHFGYCQEGENVCIPRVKDMCPEPVFQWNASGWVYTRRT